MRFPRSKPEVGRWFPNISCISAGLAIALSAGGSHALTLSEALEHAFANNPELEAERASMLATEESESQAYAALFPTVAGSGSYGYNYSRTEPGDSSDGTETSLGLTVSQRLYNGNRTRSGLNQIKASVSAQREQLLAKEQEVLLDSVTAYMDVIRDSAIMELRESNIRFLEREVEAAQFRFDVGEGTSTDISQAEANLASARSELIQTEAVLNGSRAVFVQVIGMAPDNLVFDAGVISSLPANLKESLEIANSQHPLIRQSNYSVEAANNAVSVARGSLLPTVDLVGSFTRMLNPDGSSGGQGGSQELDYRDNASLTARLSIPIFKGGTEFSVIREAKEKLKQARLSSDFTRRQIRSAVIRAWGQYMASVASITASEAGINSQQLALNGVIEEQRVGQRTTQDVLNQQRSLVNSKVGLVESQRNRIVAAYSLLSSIGELTGDSLGLELSEESK